MKKYQPIIKESVEVVEWNGEVEYNGVKAKKELIKSLKSGRLIRDLTKDNERNQYISIATGGAKSIIVQVLGYTKD